MKNILVILVGILFLFSACSGGSRGGDDPTPTPDPDYKEMVPKVKSELLKYQNNINSKDFSKAVEFTNNQSNLDFGIYPTSSVSNEVQDNSKFTLTMTEIVESSTSNVKSGRIVFEGKLKITYKDPGVSEVVINKTFKATINSSGSKSDIKNWKMSSFEILD